MSSAPHVPDSGYAEGAESAGAAVADAGPLGLLPRLSSRQARLEERLSSVAAGGGPSQVAGWLEPSLGAELVADRAEVLWRPSGLRRPGLVAQLSWPRVRTRIGLGIETPIAHAVVDRLLGYTRLDAEGRLQLTPVEWGVLTFVVARSLERLADRPGALGPWDLSIDRVGPDPFDPRDLGGVVTIRWPLRLGPVAGSVRLWLPETLVASWLAADLHSPTEPGEALRDRLGDLAGVWRAEAGTISMPLGLGRLRVGGVLPLIDSRLRGTPQSPSGPIELALAVAGLVFEDPYLTTDEKTWYG